MKKVFILVALMLTLVLAVVSCDIGKTPETTTDRDEKVTDSAGEVPTQESDTPTEEPEIPTENLEVPTEEPTVESDVPTEKPTKEPDVPTEEPSKEPDVPTEEPTKEPDVPTEEPTKEPETPTEPPVDPDDPLHTVEPDFLANYANQDGNLTCNQHIGSHEVKTEGGRTFIRLTSNGNDPYIAFIDGGQDLKIGRYMAVSYRTNTTRPGHFFMGTPKTGWTGNGDMFGVDWNENSEWNLLVVDLDNVGLTALTDNTLNFARMDFFHDGAATDADFFDIEYIAFFNTAEAAQKYDFEAHKAPMWDADKAVVTHQSFDQVYYGNGSADEATNNNLNLFHAVNIPSWDFVADMTDSGFDCLTYWGWVATAADSIGQFGYQVNYDAPIFDDAWTHPTEQPVLDAAVVLGGVTGSRMKITISAAGMADGENTVRVLYKDVEGNVVCLNEFVVKMPTKPTHYENLAVPQDQWVITGHMPQIVTPDHASHGGMIAAGGVESAALLHQGAIALGEIDLSKYSKVVIMWGCDNSQITIDHYNNNVQNRIMLVSADVNGSTPAQETVIAGATYELGGWAIQAFEIDLTEVNYNGPVYVAIDTLPGTFALFASVEFIGGEIDYSQPDHQHSYETVVTPPTCTEAGYITYICTCGDSYVSDEIAATGHSEVVDPAVAATCTTPGKTEGKHCSVCSTVIVTQKIVPAKGHTYVNGVCHCGEKDPDYVKTYKVVFVDYNGTVLSQQMIQEGHNAQAPADPQREGYIFAGWDKNFTNVNSDITITATYEIASTNPQFVVSSKEVKRGETIEVTVALKNNPGIASIVLTTTFDSNALTLTGISYNNAIGGQTVPPQSLTSPVNLYWVNAFANATGDFVLATLTFKISDTTAAGKYEISLSYHPDNVYDITETNIPFEIVKGTVTVA